MRNLLKLFPWVILLVLTLLLLWLPGNIQGVRDWVFLQTYTPEPEIVQLAKDAQLSDEARRIYYATDPQLLTKEEFSSSCRFAEFNIVVGCYNGQIFVLDIENEELEPGEIVTAAHETLHAIYDRLSDGDKQEVNRLLEQQAESITDSRLLDTMALYLEQTPETYLDELYALFGTEVPELSSELEAHYSRYFINRQSVVSIANEYDQIFADLEEEADQLADQLNELADDLNSVADQLSAIFNDLEVRRLDLQARIDSGNYDNSIIVEINQFEYEVQLYNREVAKYRLGIAEYEKLRQRYDEIAFRHENLVRDLDSNYAPSQIVE